MLREDGENIIKAVNTGLITKKNLIVLNNKLDSLMGNGEGIEPGYSLVRLLHRAYGANFLSLMINANNQTQEEFELAIESFCKCYSFPEYIPTDKVAVIAALYKKQYA